MASQLPNKTPALLQLTGICLDYGAFRALSNIDLTLGYSEVHAIVGEHGAGKSSLGMIMSGVCKPLSGQILVAGHVYQALMLNTAKKLGISMVHQHILSLNDRFSVAENLFLTTASFKTLTWEKKAVRAAAAFLAQYDVDIDPLMPVKDLNLSDRMFVDILKHLYAHPRLLILDEALEKLSADALRKILVILKQLQRAGMSILFITHRIDDIYNFADHVSIIKNGEILVTDEVKNIDKLNLIKMAYTQIAAEPTIEDLNQEFYHLLKYNEAILRNLPVNLIVTDTENRIKMVNAHCKHSFGLTKPSYLNVPLAQLVSSQNDDAFALIKSAVGLHDEKTFYQIPITVNTIETMSNMKIFPIYDGTLRIGNIIIIEDLTEYTQLQKHVMLSEKLASVGLLAAGVAHEINNPLEIIFNSLAYLKYHIHGEEPHEAMDDIQEAMESIATIVSNLHSFSDNKQSTNEDIDVNALIQNMLNLIKYNAQYKHITIHFEPAEHELTIRANKNEIKQVLLNLFKNSFEAMPSGGEIFITTVPIAENGVNYIQIRFRDTGSGIWDENPNNIFLPFYSTKKGTGHNLGLGLSVSYGIITKYKGTITAENIADSGCQFLITFPAFLPG